MHVGTTADGGLQADNMALPSAQGWIRNIFNVQQRKLKDTLPPGSELRYGSDCSGVDSPAFGLETLLGQLKEAWSGLVWLG